MCAHARDTECVCARACASVCVCARMRVSVCVCVCAHMRVLLCNVIIITFQRYSRHLFSVLLYVILSPLREGHGMTSSRCIAVSDPEGCVGMQPSA